MEVKIKKKAINYDLKKLSAEQKQKVIDEVENLDTAPLSRDDVELVCRYGFEIFRKKVEIEDLSYRALFDIQGQEVILFGFMERPPEEYTKETLSEKVGKRQ